VREHSEKHKSITNEKGEKLTQQETQADWKLMMKAGPRGHPLAFCFSDSIHVEFLRFLISFRGAASRALMGA
jgi:hypothetical protein